MFSIDVIYFFLIKLCSLILQELSSLIFVQTDQKINLPNFTSNIAYTILQIHSSMFQKIKQN